MSQKSKHHSKLAPDNDNFLLRLYLTLPIPQQQLKYYTTMDNSEEPVIFDQEEFEDLEKDAESLESQLEGLKTAEVSSAAAAKLLAHIKGEQDADDLVSGSTDNRWKELIVNEEPEVEKPDTSKCCTLQ